MVANATQSVEQGVEWKPKRVRNFQELGGVENRIVHTVGLTEIKTSRAR